MCWIKWIKQFFRSKRDKRHGVITNVRYLNGRVERKKLILKRPANIARKMP